MHSRVPYAVLMESLGTRIATVRKELGISQHGLGKMTGLGQPRLSRIERGELPASVAVIDKIATALNRRGQDLVAGTDREGYYIAEGLSPEEAAHVKQEQKASTDLLVVSLRITYERVVNLFEALHVGPFVVAEARGEEVYLGLRSGCEALMRGLGPDAPDLFFPDHFEIVEEDDVHSWELIEQPALRRSLLELRRLEHERHAPPAVYEFLEEKDKEWATVDAFIQQMREYQREQNQQWDERVRRNLNRPWPGNPK